jgi:TRAP-type transport system small permease protein
MVIECIAGLPPLYILKRGIQMVKKIIFFIYDVFLLYIVKLLGFILVFTVLLQIASRFIMTTPLSWTEELARFVFIWFSLLGSVVAFTKGQHLGIDIIYRKIKITRRKLLDICIYLLIIGFSFIMLKYGWQLVKITGVQRSPIMRICMSYMYISLPITGLLFFIFSFYQIIHLFKEHIFVAQSLKGKVIK